MLGARQGKDIVKWWQWYNGSDVVCACDGEDVHVMVRMCM